MADSLRQPVRSAKAHSPAGRLNAACHCVRLDRDLLHRQLTLSDPDLAALFARRPSLAADNVVFVDPKDMDSMDTTASHIRRALTHPVYQELARQHAPTIARRETANAGGVLGFDFHLGATAPQLIEINTNPGGLLINLALKQAFSACCGEVDDWLSRIPKNAGADEALSEKILNVFRNEWRTARGSVPMQTIAIVDDAPETQYLHPEFLLYQRLFERAGWKAIVTDPATLTIREGALVSGDVRIDFVYNRLTDFYLSEPAHAVLREAFESDAAVISPHPTAHARWSDKRLLAWLRDESLLREAGLDADARAHLLHTIPATEIVQPEHADEWWRRKKDWFFKPIDGFAGKAAFRGDKMTRTAFANVLTHPYVAQAIAPPSLRSVLVDGAPNDMKVDVRNYVYGDTLLFRAARLYQGQTTNFRTPGGGFAPVLSSPAAGDGSRSCCEPGDGLAALS
ncbi:MAG: hypothetical protein ACKVP2_13970 [Burkholderiales bacterium]